MADRSAIEWTEATWNPVTGCSTKKVAAKNHRSLHSEVLAALERYVEEHRQIIEAARQEAS